MKQLFKNKRANISEISGFLFLLILFLSLGIFMPFIQEAAGQTVIRNDVNAINDNAIQSTSTVDALDVLASIVTMFLWGFNLPFAVNLFLLPFRIMFWYLFARLVRGGG